VYQVQCSGLSGHRFTLRSERELGASVPCCQNLFLGFQFTQGLLHYYHCHFDLAAIRFIAERRLNTFCRGSISSSAPWRSFAIAQTSIRKFHTETGASPYQEWKREAVTAVTARNDGGHTAKHLREFASLAGQDPLPDPGLRPEPSGSPTLRLSASSSAALTFPLLSLYSLWYVYRALLKEARGLTSPPHPGP